MMNNEQKVKNVEEYEMTGEDYLNLYGWPDEPETEDQRIKKAINQFIKDGGFV
jgi:Icc-related predicted phosphoesterase